MICFSLNSGSNGNCIYVEAEGVRLLLDAGLSGKRTAERLACHARQVREVDAVIISHDHADHVSGAGVLARKFGLPVYMTQDTHRQAQYARLGEIKKLHYFKAGDTLCFGSVTVSTLPTPHDAAEPVIFVVYGDKKRLGILTDLGCVFPALPQLLAGLDAVYLESNYDPEMLANGPYPYHLKQRVAGEHGHLSNYEAAELVKVHAAGNLQWVSLSHLSEVNNHPELARRTHGHIVGPRRPIHIAPRYEPGPLLTVE